MWVLLLAILGLSRRLRLKLKSPEFKALFVIVSILLIVGTVFYSQIEGWGVFDSFYFCIVTLATVGYGDLTPKTIPGKIFTIVYILLGVGTLLSFVTLLAQNPKDFKKTPSKDKS